MIDLDSEEKDVYEALDPCMGADYLGNIGKLDLTISRFVIS